CVKAYVRPDYWEPNETCIACRVCCQAFSLRRPIHHCRACGAGVCDNCSLHRQPVPNRGLDIPSRVCNHCIDAGLLTPAITLNLSNLTSPESPSSRFNMPVIQNSRILHRLEEPPPKVSSRVATFNPSKPQTSHAWTPRPSVSKPATSTSLVDEDSFSSSDFNLSNHSTFRSVPLAVPCIRPVILQNSDLSPFPYGPQPAPTELISGVESTNVYGLNSSGDENAGGSNGGKRGITKSRRGITGGGRGY
ncbi:unnamed protein product, partial [Protopolystoma xenopodis]